MSTVACGLWINHDRLLVIYSEFLKAMDAMEKQVVMVDGTEIDITADLRNSGCAIFLACVCSVSGLFTVFLWSFGPVSGPFRVSLWSICGR
jgi:hypothetical protein